MSDSAAAAALVTGYHKLKAALSRRIVGQDAVIEQVFIAIAAGGHSLLEGVPGLAKTLLVKSLADAMHLGFRRIQFTPDLMPADITGTEIIQEDAETGRRKLVFQQGPIFSQIILADEINRTPPKTQAALLEAMQEKHVTVGQQTYPLPKPFFVLATQNPIEQEGTYPLPEAQLDRFMFMIGVDYPSRDEEIAIARSTTGAALPRLEHVLDGPKVLAFQDLVRRLPVPDHIYEFAVDLARKTRPASSEAPAWLKPLVSWGAGPRGVQNLILGAKARAALHGSYMVRLDDIIEVADPVLRHRVMTTFTAESDGVTSRDVAKRLVDDLAKA